MGVRAHDLRKGSNIIDACKLNNGTQNRILTLRHIRDGQSTLQLEAPRSIAFTLELPSQLSVYDPFNLSLVSSPEKRRETGLRRVMKQSSQSFMQFNGTSTRGQVSLLDKDHIAHKIQIQLDPTKAQVKAILAICTFVLGSENGRGILIYWWEVLRWLKSTAHDAVDEWTAAVIVLFSMAVPFIDGKHNQSPLAQRRKKTGLLRSSSGTAIDMASWETMIEHEVGASDSRLTFLTNPGWNWILDEQPATIKEADLDRLCVPSLPRPPAMT